MTFTEHDLEAAKTLYRAISADIHAAGSSDIEGAQRIIADHFHRARIELGVLDKFKYLVGYLMDLVPFVAGQAEQGARKLSEAERTPPGAANDPA